MVFETSSPPCTGGPRGLARVPFDEFTQRLLKALDESVYVIHRGHLEITSIVAPFPKDSSRESYAIHQSAWKECSPKFGCRILHSPGHNRPESPPQTTL